MKFFRRLFFVVFIFMLGFGAIFVRNSLFNVQYNTIVEKYSAIHNIDVKLINAVIKAESNFRKDAVSIKDAKGLMQLCDATAEWCASELGIKDFRPSMLFDPDVNIMLGTFYLAGLLKDYNGVVNNALAAYNAGPSNVNKWLNDERYSSAGNELTYIPFDETRMYVKKIGLFVKIYEFEERFKKIFIEWKQL